MELLPFDPLVEVMLNCSMDDILNLTLTCHRFHDVIRHETFWVRKYRNDFKTEIKQDKISQCLNLNAHESYVRRYTQEGGVTYGSDFFQSISNLLPRAIRTGDWEMIYYYINQLDRIIKYHDCDSQRDFIYNDLLDWEESVRAALWMGCPELGQEIMERSKGDYIKSFQRVQSNWNANLLLKGALEKDIPYSLGNINFKVYLEGALLNQNYSLADKIMMDYIRYKEGYTPLIVALKTQEYDWIDRYINLYPNIFTKKILAIAHIKAMVPNLNVDAIFDALSPGEVFDTMLCNNIYYPHLFKKALSMMKKEEITVYRRFNFPCHQDIIPLILEKYPTLSEFILDLALATPDIYDTYRGDYFVVLWNAISVGNYNLATHLIDNKPDHITEEIVNISNKILECGYKDLWAYMTKNIDTRGLYFTKVFYDYLDMKKFEDDYLKYLDDSYIKVNRFTLKR